MSIDTLPPVMGVHEIAAYASVDKSAVNKWRLRHADFPSPFAELAAGTIYETRAVLAYLARHNYPKER